ncbi:MAG: hypothetical protein HYR76_08620 [Ignavibacteria bacterium]|nr:hypothetical protein [Ignavibacteria bacterium]MBI3787581.1 hypothetical protein [Ignavibacteriales bacterium]
MTFTVTQEAGDKLGVYWEKKDEEGDNLRSDILRLVGRYWKAPDENGENKYKVKLSAAANGRTGSEIIEVMKPTKLGNTHKTVTDVFGNENINLDSIIIKFAGEYGIPPQLIKGQMQTEDLSFTPAWRYEPFQDIKIHNKKDLAKKYFGKNMPFVVDETTMGSGDLPTTHTNEDPNPYVGTPVKISTFTVQHWDAVFVQHNTGNKPDIIVGSKPLSKVWLDLYTEIKNDPSKNISDADARSQAHEELKQEIQDRKNKIGKSFDRNAQTRKVTSYGLTQMMYITAADNVFNNNHDKCYDPSTTHYVDQNDEHTYPEKLNEQDFLMPRYCDFLWKNLKITFTTCIPEGNWANGFEAKWEKALIKYHGGDVNDTYGKTVLTNAQIFKPTN